jgi:hypothetical protein
MKQTKKWLSYAILGSMALGVTGFVNAPQAMAGSDVAFAGLQRRWHESEWRQSHPNWNGRVYWHNNGYYFDRAYTTPAIVDHDWATIGAGVTLSSDPYIAFSGSYGSYYPTASVDVDLASSDPNRHARALYFQHPYFWRNGTRYDRTTVTRHGTTYYRFARHRF